MENRKLLLIAFAVGLITAACGDTIVTGPPVTVLVDSQNTTNSVGPSKDPQNGTSTTFKTVRVGIFAQSCPSGGSVPDNAQNTIIVGCTATLTATPKDDNGTDVVLPDSVWKTLGVSWSVLGSSCADIDASFGNSNPFNRQVKGVAAGTCTVCATVQGITGCAVNPNGNRVVTVIN